MENALNYKYISIKSDIMKNTDLIEIAISYCEHNSYKSDEISNLESILKIILEQQKNITITLDSLIAS